MNRPVRETIVQGNVVNVTTTPVNPVTVLGNDKCGSSTKKEFSRIRFIHNSANSPKLDIYMTDTLTIESIRYKTVSDYLKVNPGMYKIICKYVDQPSQPVLVNSIDLKGGLDYIYVIHGPMCPSGLTATMLESDNLCPEVGRSYIRVFHAAAGVSPIDVYLDNSIKLFGNIGYGKLSNPQYMSVISGIKNISITPTSLLNIILGPIVLQLEGRKIYTIILSGLMTDGQAPLSAIITEDTNQMSISYL